MSLRFCWLSTVFAVILCASIIMARVGPSSAINESNSISDSNQAMTSWTKFTVKYTDRIILNLTASGSILHGRVLGILGPSGLVIDDRNKEVKQQKKQTEKKHGASKCITVDTRHLIVQ